MKTVLRFFKAHWITVWLLIVAIGFVSFFAYAEYIKDSNRAKRVIANTTGAGDLFSSDYLTPGTGSEYEVLFDESAEYIVPVRIWNYDMSNPTFYYDDKDIVYTLEAQLVKKNPGGGYTVITDSSALTNPDSDPETNDAITISMKIDNANDSYTDFTASPGSDNNVAINATDSYTVHQSYDSTNGYKITYTGLKLYKRNRDENKVLISFPASMRTSTDKIYVKLTATPTPLTDYSGIKALSGFFDY